MKPQNNRPPRPMVYHAAELCNQAWQRIARALVAGDQKQAEKHQKLLDSVKRLARR